MILKKINRSDLETLSQSVEQFNSIDGIDLAFSTRKIEDLTIRGTAYFFAPISLKILDVIIELQKISKEHPSSYQEAMNSNDLKIWGQVIKTGSFFKTIYITNLSIQFNNSQVDVGSSAGKTIVEMIEKILDLLKAKKPIQDSTIEAIKAIS